ncbi:hypothetical protein JZ751_021131, partial [Albula glossodonta]
SIYEPLQLSVLYREDEPLWDKLDRSYRAVKSTILNFQSPTTGLFPVKTCSDCNEAKVRDSLYCAASVWALALAYRRIDDDMGRTHELEHSAIKCMRGILYCYMRQSDKSPELADLTAAPALSALGGEPDHETPPIHTKIVVPRQVQGSSHGRS